MSLFCIGGFMFKKALILFLVLFLVCSLSAQRRQSSRAVEFSVEFTYDIPPVHSMVFPLGPIHFQLNHIPGDPELYRPAFQSVQYLLTSTTPNATMRARLISAFPDNNIELAILESSSRPPGATSHLPVILDTTPRILYTGMHATSDQPLNMDFEMRARAGARIGGGSGTIQFTISE